MSRDSKKVLWDAVSALMKKHYGKENLTQLAKDCKIGPGTSTRLKMQETSVGLEVIDKIAKHFKVEPWMLLVPGFDPDAHPSLRPMSEKEIALYKRLKELAKEMNVETP